MGPRPALRNVAKRRKLVSFWTCQTRLGERPADRCGTLARRRNAYAHSWKPSSTQNIRGQRCFQIPSQAFEPYCFSENLVAIGFAEELGFRAYLIPRVEVVTGSTRKAVLFSVLAFGIAHFSKGFVGVLHSLIAAAVWSIAFCSTRRIWPVAIAHAFGDFILMTRIGAMVGKLPM